MDSDIWAKAVAFGLLGSGLIIAGVEAIKAALPPEFPSRFIPAITMTASGLVGLGIGRLIGVEVEVGILGGLLSGLGANAAYLYGKNREQASAKFQ
jgi:hypothetical protein